MNKVYGFLWQQWQTIISIIAGVFALWRVIGYIERSSINAADKERIEDAFKRMELDNEYIENKRKKMRDLSHDALLGELWEQGEYRIDR